MTVRPAFAASAAQVLGLALFEAAVTGQVPLGDFVAGERFLRTFHPGPPALSLNAVAAGRRIAIDLAVDGARHPDERPVRALRIAADLAERALTDAHTEADHLQAWRRMTELLDRALAGVAAPGAPR